MASFLFRRFLSKHQEKCLDSATTHRVDSTANRDDVNVDDENYDIVNEFTVLNKFDLNKPLAERSSSFSIQNASGSIATIELMDRKNSINAINADDDEQTNLKNVEKSKNDESKRKSKNINASIQFSLGGGNDDTLTIRTYRNPFILVHRPNESSMAQQHLKGFIKFLLK